MVDQMDLPHSDNEEIVAPSSRYPRRIHNDCETSDSKSDLGVNDIEEALKNFREVTVANHSEHNPHPQFMEIAEPKHMPPRNSTPGEYLDLFFTEEFLILLRSETNRYARQFLIRIDVPSESRATEWKTLLFESWIDEPSYRRLPLIHPLMIQMRSPKNVSSSTPKECLNSTFRGTGNSLR